MTKIVITSEDLEWVRTRISEVESRAIISNTTIISLESLHAMYEVGLLGELVVAKFFSVPRERCNFIRMFTPGFNDKGVDLVLDDSRTVQVKATRIRRRFFNASYFVPLNQPFTSDIGALVLIDQDLSAATIVGWLTRKRFELSKKLMYPQGREIWGVKASDLAKEVPALTLI